MEDIAPGAADMKEMFQRFMSIYLNMGDDFWHGGAVKEKLSEVWIVGHT